MTKLYQIPIRTKNNSQTVLQLFIRLSVYLSVSCLFPSPSVCVWGGEGVNGFIYVYLIHIDILIILSIDNLYICQSVPLRGGM